MAILTIDIGGTTVKYAVFANGQLHRKSSFKTPKTWSEMTTQLFLLKERFSKDYVLQGVGISSPGVVDSENGIVKGLSAVPYIHYFKILEALELLFGLPVSIENDANCAALAEVSFGAAQGVEDAIFFVIGSGVGGAVVLGGQLRKGPNLFAGEFGFMQLRDKSTLSESVSPVHMAKRYAQEHEVENSFSGKDLFELAAQGNTSAQKAVNQFYDNLAKGIFNTIVVLNPELVVIGGAVSTEKNLRNALVRRISKIQEETGALDLSFKLDVCQFNNDANLLGAASKFMSTFPNL
ncbi:ROK family protein [Streptococcus mutans]|uniref:ROK family protein n=1 Tax=Streptococcus mutans TaxID=1309 RepID=UPI00145585CF|nr:ROK family protein [Streptococcus mutans]NLQ38763.1 ROK family protein [Streptococcus mutans]